MYRIHPEEFSASYRRLVLLDLGSEDQEKQDTSQNTKAKERMADAKRHVDYRVDILRRLNITRDAMVDDGENVLPWNFPAVGSILLEFMNALSDHMGWPRMIEGNRKSLIPCWCDLLSYIDRDCADQLTPEFDIDKVTAFTKSFFDKVDFSRYTFFVEPVEVPTATP